MAVIKKFSCKGSYGVFYGMGIEELKIDFSDISGLVALIGGNGMSKTTVMEMFSPYAVFPSRKKKNPKGYNLKKQFMLRDSFKEVIYILDGAEYVFRVEIPAGTTMSPEGYITKDGTPIVKGKISEYKKKVVELFGSEELFYSSYFSCQGGDKLTDKTTGEFKQLLIELLGLNKYVTWWHNVGKVQSVVNSELEKVLVQLTALDEKMAEIETLNEEIEPLKKLVEDSKLNIGYTEKEISKTTETIKQKQAEKVEVEKNELIVKDLIEKKDVLEEKIKADTEKHQTAVKKAEAWISDKQNGITSYVKMVESEDAILNADKTLVEVEAERAELVEKVSDLDTCIELKQKSIDDLSGKLYGFDKEIVEINKDIGLEGLVAEKDVLAAEYSTAKTDVSEKQSALINVQNDAPLKALNVTLDQYKAAEQLLQNRPITCLDDNCPFIVSALNSIKNKPETERAIQVWIDENAKQVKAAEECLKLAEEYLASVIKNGVKCADEIKEIQASIANQVKVVEEIKEATEENQKRFKKDLDGLKAAKSLSQNRLKEIPFEIDELKSLTVFKSELKTAKEVISSTDKDISLKRVELSELIDEFSETNKVDVDALGIIKLNIGIKHLETTPAQLSFEISSNETTLKGLIVNRDALNLSVIEQEKKIAVLEDKARMSDSDTEKAEKLKKKEIHIRQELKKWDYTRSALSKSGLQALEIASAAPLLTGIANELLHSAFGGEFFLDLRTLDPETGAEILDVMVTREDGEIFPLSEYSGGESVWILQAFKAAQILVNTEKSGIHFMTAFCDEETGALDAEKAERFIQMYRAMMVKGGFEKLFYISHLPDCQAMADHSLKFKAGGIEVN